MATCSIPAKEVECERIMKPNWLQLPADIMSNILQRLGTTEIVTSACHVCPLWWKICKDPLMWRTIHITNPSNSPYSHEDLEKICRFAVKRSCGHLEDIDIEYFGTDDLLECIADNANIRCLRLARCQNISNKAFSEVVRKLPLIEKLDISHYNLLNNTLEVIGRSCPLLKSFKFASIFKYIECSYDDVAFVIARTIQGLHQLDIAGNLLTKIGLLAILDSCPLLESLELGWCLNLDFTGNLRKRCLEQIKSV
ncbi:putative F-box/LRR-repeat protein 23 [Vicia villosa]|uniref:putative F-box/LRR-repeat protein 23 n=1 Tax=Vicia villosa TaxID=3911 RepID=UPI00273C036B|nr:putative F-box/LRR-repeat protein 23 [Vicia villosa]